MTANSQEQSAQPRQQVAAEHAAEKTQDKALQSQQTEPKCD
jgi:hypothetical protein